MIAINVAQLRSIIILLLLLLSSYNVAFSENAMQNKPTIWKLATVESLKQAGAIEAKGTALLIIDFQNFNANKKGFLGQLFDDSNHSIANTKLAIAKARQANIPIIYLNTLLNPKLMPNTQLFTQLKKQIPWHTLTATNLAWNFAVIDELKPQVGDYTVEKGSWSNGFRDTNLANILKALKIHQLIFTGVAEPIAIYGTFLGAWDEGLETIMLTDCIIAAGNDQKTQELIHNFSDDIFYPMMGAKITTAKYLNFIQY